MIVEIIGWAGSALVVVALAQSHALRLYMLNGAATVVLIAYNALIGALPGVGLNVALLVVALWRIRTILRSKPAVAANTGDTADTEVAVAEP
ncbi:MAG: hypothetical protein JWP85_2670 [Rhodoglobus sp.]|nr:hypothetical protein [Rhodoglobus sp.]